MPHRAGYIPGCGLRLSVDPVKIAETVQVLYMSCRIRKIGYGTGLNPPEPGPVHPPGELKQADMHTISRYSTDHGWQHHDCFSKFAEPFLNQKSGLIMQQPLIPFLSLEDQLSSEECNPSIFF